jgi:GNAT superfamily N-acetyltransferase
MDNLEIWSKLAELLLEEPTILGSRITAPGLKGLHDSGLAVAEMHLGSIIVFGALWPTKCEDFLEAGSFWVHKSHRQQGLSSKMFQKLTRLIPLKKTAVVVTYVPKVIHLLEKAGWKEASAATWMNVVPFEVSCKPCDLVEDRTKPRCLRKATSECRLFYRNGA